MMAIRVRGFRKRFGGSLGKKPHQAAHDIGFEVRTGQVYGFLGPNGAGKTTTIKALLGLIRADGGTLEILGDPPQARGWRHRVGYLPEHPAFYPYLSGAETVVMFGRLAGMTDRDARRAADRLLDRVGLGHAKTRKLSKYSKGMLQRVGLAQALVADPELLILDEPLTGLDPVGRRELRDLFRELGDEGRTVFYSTHILSDAESTCREVCIVSEGRVRYTGSVEGFDAGRDRRYSLVLDHGRRALPDGLVGAACFSQAEPGHGHRIRLDFDDRARAEAALRAALDAGLEVIRYDPVQESLEDFFMRMVARTQQEEAA
jgi:ABC-2 type transport system ATP-binding protein